MTGADPGVPSKLLFVDVWRERECVHQDVPGSTSFFALVQNINFRMNILASSLRFRGRRSGATSRVGRARRAQRRRIYVYTANSRCAYGTCRLTSCARKQAENEASDALSKRATQEPRKLAKLLAFSQVIYVLSTFNCVNALKPPGA